MKRQSMLFKVSLFVLVFCGLSLVPRACAQSTTVSATVTDSDSIAWAGGSYTFTFYPSPNFPNIKPAVLVYKGVLDGSGAFSVSITSNSGIAVGSAYIPTICPNASVPCSSLAPIVINGSTQSLTTYIDANITAPRFPASGANQYGYSDLEINSTPLPGGQYYNVSTGFRYWNGTAFAAAGGQAGVYVPLAGGIMTGALQFSASGTNQINFLNSHTTLTDCITWANFGFPIGICGGPSNGFSFQTSNFGSPSYVGIAPGYLGVQSNVFIGFGSGLPGVASPNLGSFSSGGAGVLDCNLANTDTHDCTLRLGILQLNTITQPTCNATNAAMFNYVQGNASTKDIVQVCAHDASNVYAWRTLY